jgi:hypothetical protein
MDVFLNQMKYCTADKKLNSVGKIVSPGHKINKIVLFTCLHDVAMHFRAAHCSIKTMILNFPSPPISELVIAMFSRPIACRYSRYGNKGEAIK